MTGQEGRYLAWYRQRIDGNARAWLGFVETERDAQRLAQEQANMVKAARQALREPAAWRAAVDLVDALWPCLGAQGQWQILAELMESALAVSQQAGSLPHEADLLQHLGQLARTRGDYLVARARLREALELSRRLDDPRRACRALAHLTQTHLALGQTAEADRCCAQAMALLELVDGGEAGLVVNSCGLLRLTCGYTDAALQAFQDARTTFAAQGNQRGQATACNNQGEGYRRLGRWKDALGSYQEALGHFEAAGDEIGAARMGVNLGLVYHKQGRTPEALALVRRAEPLFRRLGEMPVLGRVLNNAGVFLSAQGRPVEAFEAYSAAAAVHLRTGDRLAAAGTWVGVAQLLMDNGLADEARGALQQARATQPGRGQVPALMPQAGVQAWLDAG